MRQKRPVVVVHDRNRKQIVKSSTSSVIQSPYFLNNAPYDDQKQTTVMTDEERRKLTAASEESERSCIHTFPDKPDESSGSNMHSPDALEASFLQLTEYGPGQDEKQTIRSAPDLIDPKDSCAIPLTFISKRDQYECYKHPFDDPACTNACSSINSPPNTFLSAVSCTHDLEKPISSNSAFEGSYVLTSQPLYDHIKRFTSSELHPVKVSIQQSESAPVSEVQAVVPADHLVAFPAVNYSGVGQHLLLAATPAHGSPFSTMNQLRLVNIVVDPEQMFPQEVIGLLSGEENYPDSGAM
ncbi:unnamed protein product [Echinostoma caproni]|uniref:Uncharacterized protein n=1 Tax=Echinostoma caproni TaxID=27848 RepID=A0A183A6P5_9TREM|nr:unnamed protein product [Echinostoma caproni]